MFIEHPLNEKKGNVILTYNHLVLVFLSSRLVLYILSIIIIRIDNTNI